MSKSRVKKFTREQLQRMNTQERSKVVRTLTCRETMSKAHWVFSRDSVADVIEDLTTNDWDHVFVVNSEGVPTGRIHAVDVRARNPCINRADSAFGRKLSILDSQLDGLDG